MGQVRTDFCHSSNQYTLTSLWWAFIIYARQGIRGDMNPILMIGFPFLTLIGIYWVRWWFLRPTYLDERQTFIE